MKRLALVLALGLLGCSETVHPTGHAASEPAASQKPDELPGISPVVTPDSEPPRAPTDAEKTLAVIDHSIAFYQERFADTRSWLDGESVIEAFIARARLTGDVADYLAAQKAVDTTFEAATPGTGPFLSSAAFYMVVHEIDRSEADLDKFEKRIWIKDAEKAVVLGLRGDVEFHRGNLVQARIYFDQAEAVDRTTASAGRLANLALRTGNYDEARRLYEVAETRVSAMDPGKKAWAILHRGIVELESNQIDAALVYFERANATYSGWYLIEEHMAEAKLLKGNPPEAIRIYKDVLSRVPNGEFFAALGDAYVEAGDDALAQKAYDDAVTAFDRDIARLPSAASGHAIEFFLAHDHARALELSRVNLELRPGHDARTKLAQALLANRLPAEALEVLMPTVQSEWATVDFLATAALVFASTDPVKSKTYRDRAESVDPTAVDSLQASLGL